MAMDFSRFLRCYPPDRGLGATVDVESLARDVRTHFKVRVPPALLDFWAQVGAGSFADGELTFFGDGRKRLDRDSLVAWNQIDDWAKILPRPSRGGPLFFAETCFGDQLGFVCEAGVYRAILFGLDNFAIRYVGRPFDRLFRRVLSERHALVDARRLRQLRRKLGPLPRGMHYAPIVSPLLGGSDDPRNFHFETAHDHLVSALAAFKAYERIQRIAE
jgi:hypothetical protein